MLVECVCVFTCLGMLRDQRRAMDPLELEL